MKEELKVENWDEETLRYGLTKDIGEDLRKEIKEELKKRHLLKFKKRR